MRKKIQCLFFLMFLAFFGKWNVVYAADKSECVPVAMYEFDNKSKYEISSSTMTSGTGLGKLYIKGNINEVKDYNGTIAYGVESGNVTFSYDYDGSLLNENSDYCLVNDNGNTIDSINLTGKILKGSLIIQYSKDGVNWTNIGNSVDNYFANYGFEKADFYTTSGKELYSGGYYKVIIAYKTKKVLKDGILFFDDIEYKKHAEVYTFYLCPNSGTISLHNLAVDKSNFESLEDSSLINVSQKGETLENGSITTKGFQIDTLGSEYSIKVNGKEAHHGDSFSSNGKYEVEITTDLGKRIVKTIYIFNGGNDKGFSTYFGNGLIDGNRAFREGEYPYYAINSCAQIKKLSTSTPPISGKIVNLTTNETTNVSSSTVEDKVYKLSPGQYNADFTVGNKTAGSVIEYSFKFNVLSEEAGPYVNYNNLLTSLSLQNFSMKHYVVTYVTTRGGHIYVCFSNEDEAYKYAYEIEKRFIEINDDGLYYKDVDNPDGPKVLYSTETDIDKIELTQLINSFARQNVKLRYFNPAEVFTYQTFDDGGEMLDNLESLSLKDSINVFSSSEEQAKLLRRKPYLNNFEFVNVADYDVNMVEALCEENGKTYKLEFLKPINEQLSVSSVYQITETNSYGQKHTYEAVFMAQNETVSNFETVDNGKTNTLEISAKDMSTDNLCTISADKFSIRESTNRFDEDAIVNVSSDAYDLSYSVYLSEAKNLTFYKKGTYTLRFVDRTNNEYTIKVNISGKSSQSSLLENDVSYIDLYNNVYADNKSE